MDHCVDTHGRIHSPELESKFLTWCKKDCMIHDGIHNPK